jgi:hypothetical protein
MLLACTLFVGACSVAHTPDQPAPASYTPAAPVSAPQADYTFTDPAPVAVPTVTYPLAVISPGTYLIPSEVTPGKYVTEGAASCYWEIARENPDKYGSTIIKNGNANGHTTITIPAGAYSFQVMSVSYPSGSECSFTKR